MEQDSEPQCYYTYTVGMKKIGNPKDRTEIGEAIKIEFMSDMLICTRYFNLPDQNGDIHTLDEFKGKKILLYFYPKDNTPGCTKQAQMYSSSAEKFIEKNEIIIGISKDSVKSHKNFEEKQNLSITLLSDTEKEAITSYDVWKEKKNYGKVSMGVVRTTYLIDEEGTIVFANDKVKAAEDAVKMLEQLG